MDVKSIGIPLATFFLLLSVIFPPPSSALNLFLYNVTRSPPFSDLYLSYSTVLPLQGNVNSLGYYTVSLRIGSLVSPPYPITYDDLIIDTGSDLSWIQCNYKTCKGCTVPQNKRYKPRGVNIVKCGNPLCGKFSTTPIHPCTNPKEPCGYGIRYADQTTSKGVLVEDQIPLESTRGSLINPVPKVVFGCANDLDSPAGVTLPKGLLGLGNGKSSFLSQLHSLGLISNVMGHCLSGKEGGYLFFGDNHKLIPSSGIVWTPIVQSSSVKSYDTGPADLYFDGQPTSVKGLELGFDSGSTATYLNSEAYKAVVDLVDNNLRGKPLKRVTNASLTLPPNCWEGEKPFTSVSEVKGYFKTLELIFTKAGNSKFQLPPEAYLFLERGYICLGIFDGSNPRAIQNVIGAVSLQDKIVIYDNEKQRIGWIPADCDKRPKS